MAEPIFGLFFLHKRREKVDTATDFRQVTYTTLFMKLLDCESKVKSCTNLQPRILHRFFERAVDSSSGRRRPRVRRRGKRVDAIWPNSFSYLDDRY